MRVIVRDWLNANSVVLREPDCNVVIDTGYSSRAHETLALLRQPEYLGDKALQLVINTHCHSDYMGGNAVLARAYGRPVAVPKSEGRLIREWDTRALWLDYADQHAERFAVDEELVGGRRYGWGGLSWDAIAAPGHDMGAMVFYCEAEQLLISGDTLWENGFGVVLARPARDAGNCARPPGSNRSARRRRSHSRARSALYRYFRSAGPLLPAGGRQLPLSKLSGYPDSVPVYREHNRAYLGLAPSALAEALVSELEHAGAVTRSGEFLGPAVRRP